jgi:drug/metabolite transporter (DMT)-like permease
MSTDNKTPLVPPEKPQESKDMSIKMLVVYLQIAIITFVLSECIKKGIQVYRGVSAFEFIFLRSLVAGFLSWIIARYYRKHDAVNAGKYDYIPEDRSLRKILMWRTIIMTAVFFVIMLIFQLLPLTLWCVFGNLSPFFTILIQWLFL